MSNNAESNVPITNTLFPPPPAYYKRYASYTAEASGTNKGKGIDTADISSGDRVANVEEDSHENTSEGIEPPRADWIREEGRWMCFGQMFTVDPLIPTAESIGLPPLISPDESPQTSLPPLLHSFLHTLLLLVDTLTNTARIPGELEEKGWAHEGDQYIQHLTNLAATMMVSANQLRGVQAESTLVLLMEKQLAVRKQETQHLRDKCQSLSQKIRALKSLSADL